MEYKLVVNMHGVKMKIVVIRGKADGLAEGPPTIEPPNEAWKKNLNFLVIVVFMLC